MHIVLQSVLLYPSESIWRDQFTPITLHLSLLHQSNYCILVTFTPITLVRASLQGVVPWLFLVSVSPLEQVADLVWSAILNRR